MTALRAAMTDLGLEVAALAARQPLPPASRRPTLLALQRILAGRDSAPATPPKDRLHEAWLALRECQRTGASPRDLPPKALSDAIWLLWEKDRRACAMPGVLAAVQALASGSTRLLKRFIEAWLRDYDPADQAMRQAGSWLADAVMRASPAAMAVWRRAEQRYGLFGSPDGPASIARAVLAGNDPSPLNEFGFDTPARGTGGTMRAITRQAALLLPPTISTPGGAQVLDRVLPVFMSGDALRFDSEPEMRGIIADALVGAWTGTGAVPSDALRPRVLDVLLTRIGDPRTRPARWERASEKTRQTISGWLAQVTLIAFFGVIGEYAGAAGMGHQWKAREKFWSACLRKKWIDEAWLVLGSNVFRHVARTRALLGSYGALDGSSVNNHSALLMRIGSTMFVEWSHNGRLYAWPADSSSAPRLYKKNYAADALKSAGLGFPPPADRPDLQHLSGPGLGHHAEIWPGRVAALLRQRDNHLRIEPREWA